MKKSGINLAERILRYTVLASVLILTTTLGWLHSVNKAIPPIDSFCPFGGLESLMMVITQGVFLRRVAMSSFILLGITIILALVFRRAFCGRICPLGFLQELFGGLGRMIFRGRTRMPAHRILIRLDKWLRYLKYLVLLYFLAATWMTGILVIRSYDPWIAYHHLFSDELMTSYLIGFIILVLSLVVSLFVDRPFCRYLCPMGGFLGLISKIGLFRIRRDSTTCIDCGKCDAACPVSIPVQSLDSVKSAECLSCAACTTACPVDGALSESLPGKKIRRIKPLTVAIIVTLFFAGAVSVTSLTDQFTWNRYGDLPKTVRRILRGPEYIQGENSLLEIVYVYRIPPQILAEKFGITAEGDFYIPLDELGIDAGYAQGIVTTYMETVNGYQAGGESCSGDH